MPEERAGVGFCFLFGASFDFTTLLTAVALGVILARVGRNGRGSDESSFSGDYYRSRIVCTLLPFS